MSRPDLNLLLALDALLDEGSVIGAARRMHLSAPAMSRTLSRIREALGDPVFVQVGRKLMPTPKALAMREQVRLAVEQASQVFASDAEIDLKSLDRRFNVRATDEFVSIHLGHLLDAMAREMPRAMLRFSPEEDDVDDEALRSGRIDLFISASRKLGPEIRVQSLFTTTFVGVARANHPIFDDEITPERLTRWEHINVSRRSKAVGPSGRSMPRWRRRGCVDTSPWYCPIRTRHCSHCKIRICCCRCPSIWPIPRCPRACVFACSTCRHRWKPCC